MNKKLTIAAAVTLLASGGMMFAACGNKNETKDEYAGKIVVVSADNKKTAYDNWGKAFAAVKTGESIELHSNVVVDEMIDMGSTKSITIDGLNKYSISASNDFSSNNLFKFGAKSDKKFEELVFNIKNCKINANGKARAIYLDNCELVIEGTEISGGKVEANDGAGVVITGKSVFEMKSGSITGNTIETPANYSQKASNDLWLGSEVEATISGGKVGKIFKNANVSGTQEGQGKLIQEGGEIDQVYLEYDGTYAATFTHKKGSVGTLIIRNSQGDGKETKLEGKEIKDNTKYTGNKAEGEAIVAD